MNISDLVLAIEAAAEQFSGGVKLGWMAMTLCVLWSIEWLTGRGGDQSGVGKIRHGMRNLGLAGINALVLLPVGGLTILAASQASQWDWTLLRQIDRLPAVQFFAGILVLDAWTYVWHRMNHRSGFLWRFHRVHHTDRKMDVTSAGRFHVGELGLAACFRIGLIAVTGLSVTQVLLHELVLVTASMFHHSKLDLGRIDRFLRVVVVTPGMHQVHHSRVPDEMHSNFASILSVWDRIGRTFNSQAKTWPIDLGVVGFDDQDRDQSLPGMLMTPMRADRPEMTEEESSVSRERSVNQ